MKIKILVLFVVLGIIVLGKKHEKNVIIKRHGDGRTPEEPRYFGKMSETINLRLTATIRKADKLSRKFRGYLSSDMERTVLKSTYPDNNPAKRKHVNRLIDASKHFSLFMSSGVYNRDWKDGPFWSLLLKLWRQIKGKDWRTGAKSLYVLHRLSRETTVESWKYFSDTLVSARKQFDSVSKGTKIFSIRYISYEKYNGQDFTSFVKNYASYVLERLENFPPTIVIEYGSVKNASEKLERMLDIALKCGRSFNVEGEAIHNDITADCFYLLIADTIDIWKVYRSIILNARCTSLKGTFSYEFYNEKHAKVSKLVRQGQEIAKKYGLAPILIDQTMFDTLKE